MRLRASLAASPSARRGSTPSSAYFFPGGVVNGDVPTLIAGLGFSAFGFRVSLFLRT